MEYKDLKERNQLIKTIKLLLIIVAIFTFISIIITLITGYVSMYSYILKCSEVITYSIIAAYILGHIEVCK